MNWRGVYIRLVFLAVAMVALILLLGHDLKGVM